VQAGRGALLPPRLLMPPSLAPLPTRAPLPSPYRCSYGFVSFLEPMDALAAMKDMTGKYIGNRPIRIKRANWMEKSVVEVRKKEKAKEKRDSLGAAGGGGGGVGGWL
jgi:hypothetical protein